MTRRKFSGGHGPTKLPLATGEEKLARLVEALADDAFAQSDADLDEDIRADGEEPAAVAERMRSAVERLLKSGSSKPK